MNTKTNTILRYINVGLCCLLAILFILPVMKLDIVQPNGEYLIHFSIGQFFGFAQLIEDFMKSYNATQSLNDQSLILFANAAKELYMLILFLILPLVGILLSLLPRTIKVSWLTGVVALICLVCFSVFYHQIDSNISAFNAQMSGFYSMNSYQRSGYSYMFSMAPYGYLYVLLCLASVVVSIVLFIKREKPVAVQVLVDPTTGRVVGSVPVTVPGAPMQATAPVTTPATPVVPVAPTITTAQPQTAQTGAPMPVSTPTQSQIGAPMPTPSPDLHVSPQPPIPGAPSNE
ncbi:hypothetical protein IV60_GL000735 [Lancefieldella rimae]|uniref:Uncharacterized protein n=2 Tax=Lancefieldella rimae TaxID=1383 RepID=B9CM00_LANR4|nr:hypothetical protein [Lancefieldella rimae]EEE17578.1 hypothetical protein ATORI0001_1336 [Lancefieldella rimae ATCC 49626]KRO02305.1 hypothetical protein IV60_GL000735 [Lancefieldella rimae]OFR22782.1 hypothetical protein HMPREF2898_04590 [Atopobium sp. HMSC064B08]